VKVRIPLAIGIAASVVLAYWVRLQFIALYGGSDPTYLEWARQEYFGGLSEFYLAAADQLRNGQPYLHTNYPPGYPLLLAGLQVAGCADPACLREIQAALDSATVPLVALLALWAGAGAAAAMAIAVTYALHPLWAAGSTFLIADALSPLLMVVTMVAAAGASRSRSALSWAGAGLACGVAALVRPDLLLMVGGIAVWCAYVVPRTQLIPAVAALCAAFALTVIPWGLHNRVTHGEWILTSASGGSGLWQGLGTLPNEYGYVVGDSAAAQHVRAAGFEFGTPEGDRYLRREYWKAATDHPMHVARVIGDRWRQILFTSERLQPLFFGRLRQWLDATGIFLVVLAAVLARQNPVALLLVLLPPLYALSSVGIVYVEPRYVRYVQLGYAFSAVLVASALWRTALAAAPRWALTGAATAAVGALLYVLRELAHLAKLATGSFPS
jgi:hypothetical protein